MSTVRKGQAPAPLARNEFHLRFMQSFYDPAYKAEHEALARLEDIAFQAYTEGRKAPITRKAGQEFADPDYDLSVEWRATRDQLIAAQQRWGLADTPSRVLLVCGSSRNDAAARAKSPRPSGWCSWPKKCSRRPGSRSTCWT